MATNVILASALGHEQSARQTHATSGTTDSSKALVDNPSEDLARRELFGAIGDNLQTKPKDSGSAKTTVHGVGE